VEGRLLPDRDAFAQGLVGVIGLVAFFVGLAMLAGSEDLGFDAGEALSGVLGQLRVTLPAAILVLAATALELAAGLVLARAARSRPFHSVAEALLAAMVAVVLKDTLLLGLLGGFGLFRGPVLVGVDVLVLGALWLPPVVRRVRPLTALASWRDVVGSLGSWPIAALIGIVWAGPVVLQLASPVVPFVDVLPNYVGPVEHLRTFGWFSPLTATQSPIIGPSRTVLGYDALLGALATMTNLSGALAIGAFILPQTVLVAAGAHRLVTALRRRAGTPIGPWALLAFALTQSFGRLADARGTVVVVPLVCLGLALAAEALRTSPDDEPVPAADPWRIGRGAAIGMSLGAATLVHPVIGFFAVVTVAIAGLLRPRELAVPAFVAALTAGLVALPQLATMVGVSLPTFTLGVSLPLAVLVGCSLGMAVGRREAARATIVHLAELGRRALAVATVGVIALLFASGAVRAELLPDAAGNAVTLALESSGILLVALIAGIALGSRGAGSPIVLAGLAVGVAAVLVAGVLPGDLGFLGDALRFEVPKTVHYWLSTIAAAGAGVALAHVWATRRVPWAGRAAAAATLVAVAALPLRPEPIDAYHLGEHRYAESFAIDLRFAGSGFWRGFPDSRTVVDGPRRELLDAVRTEIEAGRLRHDTPILHVARSFQQWVATPLGVFAGVHETFVSLDPEVSHQTAGGRLYGLERLVEFLESRAYPYVVLEPGGLDDGVRDAIVAAGYDRISGNDQGEMFVLGN
jgi:hypothetical protein